MTAAEIKGGSKIFWSIATICLLLGLSANSVRGDADECLGAPVLLTVDGEDKVFSAAPSLIGALPSSESPSTYTLKLAESRDGCATTTDILHSGPTALLVQRGNCSFFAKASTAEVSGASAVIVVNDEPGCLWMSGNETQSRLNITAVSVSSRTGDALRSLSAAGTNVTIQMPQVGAFDGSQVILLVMAVATLVGGSLLGARDFASQVYAESHSTDSQLHKELDQRSRVIASTDDMATIAARGHISTTTSNGSSNSGSSTVRQSASCASRSSNESPSGSPHSVQEDKSTRYGDVQENVVVTPATALMLLAFASGGLLTMWLLIDRIYLLLVAGICAAAQPPLCLATLAVVARVWPSAAHRETTVSVGCWRSVTCLTANLVIVPCCLGVATLWFANRSASVAWIYQDAMGMAIVMSALRSVRLTSLKSAALLLGAMLMYDAFFVFIQPLVTQSPSVMVEVATGGTTEQPLPIVLLVPAWSHFSIKGYSILGLGDIMMPGLLASMCHSWDEVVRPRPIVAGHFMVAMLAYVSGLCLTYVALLFSWFGDSGQPALVWIVPCMLSAVTVSGWCRGELWLLWKGWDNLLIHHTQRHSSSEAAPLLYDSP